MLARALAYGLRLLAVVVPAMLGGAVASDLDALPAPVDEIIRHVAEALRLLLALCVSKS